MLHARKLFSVHVSRELKTRQCNHFRCTCQSPIEMGAFEEESSHGIGNSQPCWCNCPWEGGNLCSCCGISMATRQASHDTDVRVGVLLLLYLQHALFPPLYLPGHVMQTFLKFGRFSSMNWRETTNKLFHLLMSGPIAVGQQSVKQVTFVSFQIGGFAPVLVIGAVPGQGTPGFQKCSWHMTFNFSTALPFTFVSVNSQQQHAPTQPHKPLI